MCNLDRINLNPSSLLVVMTIISITLTGTMIFLLGMIASSVKMPVSPVGFLIPAIGILIVNSVMKKAETLC